MEQPAAPAPPPSATAAATTVPIPPPANLPYPDSVDSSPRSRTTDTWESGAGEPLPPVPGGAKLRLMCSYGGHIVPRPHDKSLCYVGGDTRIVVVDRNFTLPELLQWLSRILFNGQPFTLKYQLPNEDLDSLITVSTEEDLENMVDEYDRLIAGSNPAKPSRIRLFLFPTKLDVAASMGSILDGSSKSDDWFMNALNGPDILQRGFSDPASVNSLLGLEDKVGSSGNLDPNSKEGEGQVGIGEGIGVGLGGGKGKVGNLSNQDVRSVPDSPVIATTLSFGSASSAPSLANLPPIRVRVEEGVGGGGAAGGARVFDQRAGIEDQFAQLGVSVQKQEEGFAMMSSPPSVPPNFPVSGVVAGAPAVAAVDYANRAVSDDERSDHGVPVGYRKPPQPQSLMVPSSQPQHKQISGDLPSPDSVSSDSSLSNAVSRQRPVIYQDPSGQITSGSGTNRVPANFMDPKMAVTDTGTQVPIQQVSDSAYVLPPQYDQHQRQSIHPQQQQTQPQQFIHPSNQYLHHHPAGGVPISYYPVYPSQQPHHHQQIDQRYPVYYVPAGQAHPYNMPVQQPSYGEAVNMAPSSQPQAPPNPTLITRNVAPAKAEIAQAGPYRTATTANPQLVQVSTSHPAPAQAKAQAQAQAQAQFVGYSQIHHPSQSIAPTSAAAYGYELADPAHAQIYFTQPLAPQMAAQYQTMTSAPTMVLPDASSALSTDSVKPHIRTSQGL